MQPTALIIVPCYNEASRLDMGAFGQFQDRYSFLFVNDGSTDATSELIKPFCGANIYLHELPKNGGKAEAVRQGFLYALNTPVLKQFDWIGFWDADLSTPLEEIERFFLFRQYFMPQAKAIIGSRVKRLGSIVSRKLHRHLLGRLFATVADNLFHLGCYDTQCGAKIFHRELVPHFATEPFISNWAFDVELLVRIRNYPILEYPVAQWQDIAGSKLKVSRVAFRILNDFYRMNKKYNK